MEDKKNFKVLVKPNTTTLSNTGKVQPKSAKTSPVNKSLLDIGLSESNSAGEANIRKSARNPKGAGKKLKARDINYYPLHKIIELYNKVYIVLKPDSNLNVANFAEFIHATEDNKVANDIVDILPPLFDGHFNIIANSKSRIMIGDTVSVNFKYRSTIELKAIKQKEPRKVVDVKFVNLVDMTVVVAYLDNKDFFPINELDLHDTD